MVETVSKEGAERMDVVMEEAEGSGGREGREMGRRRVGREDEELGLVFLLERKRRWRVRRGVTTT